MTLPLYWSRLPCFSDLEGPPTVGQEQPRASSEAQVCRGATESRSYELIARKALCLSWLETILVGECPAGGC